MLDTEVNNTNFSSSNFSDLKVQGTIKELSIFASANIDRVDFSGSKFIGRMWSNPNF